jgi:Tol biopolymer transport system component/predicted small lipoprotein YifL
VTALTAAFSSLVVVAVLVLALGACGGASPMASTSPSASPSPSVAPSESATPLPRPTVAGTIAFAKVVTTGDGGNSDIYVVNPDGTALKQLTDTPGWETNPSWSPDGTRIVYAVYAPRADDTIYATLWVMNADGSNKRRLTKGSVRGDWAVWSPDGKKIAFMRALSLEEHAIFSVKADGSGLRRVTHPAPGTPPGGQVDHFPAWAPSGKILFLRLSDVCAIGHDGSGLVQLTKVGNIGDFALSPDGKRIAIDSKTSQSIEIVPARGGGTPVTVLHPISDFITPDPYAAPAWTPDGKALAMASSSHMGSHGSRLYIVNADGSGLSAVPGIDNAEEPDWRPR